MPALAPLLLLAAAAAAAPSAGDPPLPPDRTGSLFISGWLSDDVAELAPDGTLLGTFTAPGVVRPRGVAVDERGNVAVVCQGSQRILLFDLDGAVVREVTHPDLVDGTGLARSPDGRWYVGNFSPGRVVVFDADWRHVATVAEPGLRGVNCVAFEPGGGFAVSNALDARIHRFDAAHAPVGVVTHPSLASPMSIALDSTGARYVSNGASTVVTKFDASWSFVGTFGAGVLSGPQGVAVDERDVLTVTSFSSSDVARFDTAGNHLGSFALPAISVGRNAAWQSSAFALAHAGGVGAAPGVLPTRVLRANGGTGDALGRLVLAPDEPLRVALDLPPGAPSGAGVALYAWRGEPAVASVAALPFDGELGCLPPPFAGGAPAVLVNSIGREGVLGAPLLPPATAPGVLLDLPGGVGRPITVTLQGVVEDPAAGGSGWSATNALVLEVR